MQTDSGFTSERECSIRGVPDEQAVSNPEPPPHQYPQKQAVTNPEPPPHQYPQNTYTFRKANAIIANFRDYHPTVQKKLQVRERSEHDVDNLKTTFGKMGCCIDVKDPWVTPKELNDFLKNLQKVADDGFDAYDCFILVVMAHGAKEGVIYGLNGEKILIEDIWGLFTADKCGSLAGKPKFFFFQACRGDKLGKGVVHADDESSTKDVCEPEPISIPVQADILLVFSTFEGTSSIRDKKGTPFIQDLCDVLLEDSKKEERLREPILNLMTYLCHDTACRCYIEKEGSIKPFEKKCDASDLRKQIPTVISTLRKLFYFRN